MIDVRNWGTEQVMQLPDNAFGGKYIVFTRQVVPKTETKWWMVRQGLPERFVLWSIRMGGFVDISAINGFRFSLGNEDPVDVAQFNTMEPLFKGDFDDPDRFTRITVPSLEVRVMDMRMAVESRGKHFVVEGFNTGASSGAFPTIEFLISPFPRSVPKWLLYQRDESLES
ncbi:MAG: hypothetical protein KAT00_02220 [Planctomycetes bacterium]|nr:hypothetical protein [Planctomycetota bacterium]